MVMRQGIQTEVLIERYANTYQYGFVAEMGFDVVLSHAWTFQKISGFTPLTQGLG